MTEDGGLHRAFHRCCYRAQMPQAKVREELIRCSGTQFDPEYTRIMLQLIDQDPNYTMREHCIE